MHKAIVLIMFVFLINCCYANCSENQIDINSASLNELQEITGIGPVYAQRIIDNRPFSSLDGLIEVNGIAEKRLEDIKSQELACVSEKDIEEENESNENSLEENEENPQEDEEDTDKKENTLKKDEKNTDIEELKKEIERLKQKLEEQNSDYEEYSKDKVNINKKPKTIKLSSSAKEQESIPKNIKSSENLEDSEKSDYALYGLVTFSFLICILVFIRRKKIKEELV